MKFYVDVEGRTFELDFQEVDGRVRVEVDGRRATIDLRQVSPPSFYSLLIDNRSYDVLAELRDGAYDILIGSEMFHLTVQDEWARRLANIQRKTDAESGQVVVKAPMPGAVVAVEVAAGQDVKRGQGLLVLSAMKMENQIKAPRAGRIVSVEVQPGQTVEQGRALVVIA
jgi:biotin carboxyl carrier protein